MAVHRRAVQTPGVLVYRLDDRLFFANARYVKGRIREAIRGAPWEVRLLVFDAEAVTHVDVSGLEALGELVGDLDDAGIGLAVARLETRPKQDFDDAGLTDAIGPGPLLPDGARRGRRLRLSRLVHPIWAMLPVETPVESGTPVW